MQNSVWKENICVSWFFHAHTQSLPGSNTGNICTSKQVLLMSKLRNFKLTKVQYIWPLACILRALLAHILSKSGCRASRSFVLWNHSRMQIQVIIDFSCTLAEWVVYVYLNSAVWQTPASNSLYSSRHPACAISHIKFGWAQRVIPLVATCIHLWLAFVKSWCVSCKTLWQGSRSRWRANTAVHRVADRDAAMSKQSLSFKQKGMLPLGEAFLCILCLICVFTHMCFLFAHDSCFLDISWIN